MYVYALRVRLRPRLNTFTFIPLQERLRHLLTVPGAFFTSPVLRRALCCTFLLRLTPSVCADGKSIICLRVREWPVPGPRYISENLEWVQQMQAMLYFDEGETAFLLFRLLKIRQGETWKKLHRTPTKYLV